MVLRTYSTLWIWKRKTSSSFACLEISGGLTNQDFITAGLPAGIPVAMGGGDTACSAFAVGVMEHNQVFESAGTSNVITVCSENPILTVDL